MDEVTSSTWKNTHANTGLHFVFNFTLLRIHKVALLLKNPTYADGNCRTHLSEEPRIVSHFDGDPKNAYYDSLKACNSSLGKHTFFLETGGLRFKGFSTVSTGVGLGVRVRCVVTADSGGDVRGGGGGGVAGRGGSGGGGREGGGGGGGTIPPIGCIMEATTSDTSSTAILVGQDSVSATSVAGLLAVKTSSSPDLKALSVSLVLEATLFCYTER